MVDVRLKNTVMEIKIYHELHPVFYCTSGKALCPWKIVFQFGEVTIPACLEVLPQIKQKQAKK